MCRIPPSGYFDVEWRLLLQSSGFSVHVTCQASCNCKVSACRTELYGRIVHSRERGVPRQRLFVCSKSKKMSHERYVAFKAINGKLPPIQVSWPKGTLPPSISDLHVVEVRSWEGDRPPNGKYIKSLKMDARNSDAAILEPVQISMNFCDWVQNPPASEHGCLPQLDVASRVDLRNSGPMVGIQHSGLPASVLVSCEPGTFVQVHVLDVNAYLESGELQQVQEVVQRRAVGVWFMDHEDLPLDASLPLFPPYLEKELSFKEGSERVAVTFTFPLTERQAVDFQKVEVSETLVQCQSLLSPKGAGSMIIGETDGGEVGTTLRLLADYAQKFERSEIARESLAVFEHLNIDFTEDCRDRVPETFAQLVSCRMMRTLMHLVDRHVGRCLDGTNWSGLLSPADSSLPVTVKYSHARPDPSTWKVMERLLRSKPCEGRNNLTVKDAVQSLMDILEQPGISYMQKHCFQSSFVRRLRNSFPQPYYEVLPLSSEIEHAEPLVTPACSFFRHERVFHVTAPLQRNLDILGMRALKFQLGLMRPRDHMLLKKQELQGAIARANARTSAHNFGLHIFRMISWMKELSLGREVSDALIGAVGPSYINVLVPTPCAHILELKVPVAALCGDTFASDYDVSTQSIMLTNGASLEHRLEIRTWYFPRLMCTISRNSAQPIPHHAAANSVIVTHLDFKTEWGPETTTTFPVGQRMFPEMFSSCPDLTEWAIMDRRLEKYSELWARVRTCQVHAAAVNGSSYTRPARVDSITWRKDGATWYFKCRVEVPLAQYQRLHEDDLAVLTCQHQDRILELRGVIAEAWVVRWRKAHDQPSGAQAFMVEVKLSQACYALKETHSTCVGVGATFNLYFIFVPRNEKKSIRMLQAIPKTPPLQGMPLTSTRTTVQQKRELEMRPLLTVQQVKLTLDKPEYRVQSCKGLNDKQLLALKRGLQQPFTMVQGPPGTGKTSLLERFIVAAVSIVPGKAGGDRPRILVCAPSNQAADHLLDRLIRDTDIPDHYITRVYSRSIEQEDGSTYANRNSRSERKFDIQSHLREYALHEKVSRASHVSSGHAELSTVHPARDRAHEMAEKKVLEQSYIVITTCANSYLHTSLSRGEQQDKVRPISFHTAVIDEAAQASEPDVVLAATLAAQRIVVVGDHQQLGPVVPERNLCAAYVSALETPFLERMTQNPRRLRMSTMLDVQYRMHPSIRSFPSAQFYESKLQDGVSVDYRPKLRCLWPQEHEHRLFIDCSTPQSKDRNCSAQSMQGMTSLKNSGEADVVSAVCACLLEQGCSGADMAVLTPYTSQQHEIRAKLERSVGHDRSHSILVGTVHALQGSEREYIILSFVRSLSEEVQDISPSKEAFSKGDSMALRELRMQNLGIVSNRKLLNVALTRAKYGLVCVGNKDVLSSGSKDFLDLITSLESRRCLMGREAFLQRIKGNRWARKGKRLAAPPAIRPEDSISQVAVRPNVFQDDEIEHSEVSVAASSISVLSECGHGPKCFLRGTLLPAASGLKVPVECVDVGTRISAAGNAGLALQVTTVTRHDNEHTGLVQIETDSASIVVTSTHLIVMANGERRQASGVVQGEVVSTSGGRATVPSLQDLIPWRVCSRKACFLSP